MRFAQPYPELLGAACMRNKGRVDVSHHWKYQLISPSVCKDSRMCTDHIDRNGKFTAVNERNFDNLNSHVLI